MLNKWGILNQKLMEAILKEEKNPERVIMNSTSAVDNQSVSCSSGEPLCDIRSVSRIVFLRTISKNPPENKRKGRGTILVPLSAKHFTHIL